MGKIYSISRWNNITDYDKFVKDVDGVICRLGRGHTEPTDTCPEFALNSTFDSLQDPNKYQDKSKKLYVFKNL